MQRLTLALVLLIAAIAAIAAIACSGGSSSEGVPAPTPLACATDERVAEDGTCELFASAAVCAPGTRPAVGSDGCIAVGTTSCAAGFTPEPSGWGCAPLLPPSACVGATRPRLGDAACVPVGDCAAPFMTANAIVVDPLLADAAVDATHVRTLPEALALASDGATIALADGTHQAGPLAITKAVALVGRCAARARLVPVTASGGAGLQLGAKIALRGVTLEGYTEALTVTGPGELVAEDIVIEHARSRAIYAQRAAKVTLRRSVIRGTTPIGASDQTVAVLVGTSAQVDVDDSAIVGSLDAALVVTDSVSTRAALTHTVVSDTRPRPDGVGGGALRAFQGARLDITESAILGSTGMALLTFSKTGPPPEVTIKRSVIKDTVALDQTGTTIGTAVNAAYGAVVHIEETTIADSESNALYAAETASITFARGVVLRVRRSRDISAHAVSALRTGSIALEDAAVIDVGALGVGGWDGGHVTLLRSLVRDIGGDVVQGLPMGHGLEVTKGSTIEATDCAIIDALEIGVSATNPGSAVRLDHVLVTRTPGASPPRFGHAVLGVDSAAITVVRSIVERQAGVGLFFASGGGVVSASLVRDNAVAAHVQEGSSLREADAPPDVVPSDELVVTKDTRFVGNTTRVGSGELPLPAPLAAP